MTSPPLLKKEPARVIGARVVGSAPVEDALPAPLALLQGTSALVLAKMRSLDLSQSHTPGFRNTTNEVRPFGVPTVRSDIPKYARKSIADNQNYGDDVNAQFLLYPGEFTSIGANAKSSARAERAPTINHHHPNKAFRALVTNGA